MDHPITPPPELVREWLDEWINSDESGVFMEKLATEAARWGADAELEACCAWTAIVGGAEALRNHRRPKPPSLAEQALEQLSSIRTAFKIAYGGDLVDTPIRRALERLQELEQEVGNGNV